MIRPLSSEFSILLSDVKSQLAGRTKTSYGPRVIFSEAYQFQSTAPVWGPTSIALTEAKLPLPFQSTAPVWGPTGGGGQDAERYPISIHGPRVGADASGPGTRSPHFYFNPRPPCGGRLDAVFLAVVPFVFQSTAPVWGPTGKFAVAGIGVVISIHGPRVGADARSFLALALASVFQSTAPVWGPTLGEGMAENGPEIISIHGPRVGADQQLAVCRAYAQHFNPRPPCGGRLPIKKSMPSS